MQISYCSYKKISDFSKDDIINIALLYAYTKFPFARKGIATNYSKLLITREKRLANDKYLYSFLTEREYNSISRQIDSINFVISAEKIGRIIRVAIVENLIDDMSITLIIKKALQNARKYKNYEKVLNHYIDLIEERMNFLEKYQLSPTVITNNRKRIIINNLEKSDIVPKEFLIDICDYPISELLKKHKKYIFTSSPSKEELLKRKAFLKSQLSNVNDNFFDEEGAPTILSISREIDEIDKKLRYL